MFLIGNTQKLVLLVGFVTSHNLHITITIPVLHISIQAYSFSKYS